MKQVSRKIVAARTEAACRWFADNLRIIDKQARLVPFVANAEQQKFLFAVFAQREAGVPVRMIILKDRKIGISTAVGGLIFMDAANRENRHALVAAHDDDASQNLFAIPALYQQELPPAEKLPLVNDADRPTKKSIAWARPHRSIYEVQTAGKINLARSYTLHDAHLSEVAWWRNQKQTLNSVLNAVPNETNTMVVIESTANGSGDEFDLRFQSAVKRQQEHPEDLGGWLPLFFSWLEHAEYRAALDEGETLGDLDEIEQELVSLGAMPEQLKWRRRMLADNCGGDVELFKQEYPATVREAFITTGRRAIPPKITDAHRSTVLPGRPATLEWLDRAAGKVAIRFLHHRYEGGQFVWTIFDEPGDLTQDYIVYGDVARGLLADPDDPRSDPDLSEAIVLRRTSLEQVAELSTYGQTDQFGEELLKAACLYHHAWASPEANSYGLASLNVLKNYPYHRLYRRDGSDDSVDVRQTAFLGWETTTGNRDQMIDDYLAYCRQSAIDGYRAPLIVHSAGLVDQEETFVRTKSGKREARRGAHDDKLFAIFGALQLHQRCPRTRQVPRYEEAQETGNDNDTPFPGDQDFYVPGHSENSQLLEVE
jgi:hypothetical protein